MKANMQICTISINTCILASFDFRRKLFPRGVLVRPSCRGPSLALYVVKGFLGPAGRGTEAGGVFPQSLQYSAS